MNASLSTPMAPPRALSAGAMPYLLFGFLAAVPMLIWINVGYQMVPGRAWIMVALCLLIMAVIFFWIGYFRVILTNETIFYRTLFQPNRSIDYEEIERAELKSNFILAMLGSGRTLKIIPKASSGKPHICINTLFLSRKDLDKLVSDLNKKLQSPA